MNQDTQGDTSAPLFRKEVTDRSKYRWFGEVQLATPTPHWLYFSAACVAILGIAVILVYGRYTKHIEATGTLVPKGGLLTLKAPITGVVTSIFVESGDIISGDDRILSVAKNTDSPSVGRISAAVENALVEQMMIAERGLVALRKQTQVRKSGLRNKLAALRAQIPEINSQFSIQQRYVASAKKVLGEYESVESQGLVSDPELQQQRLALFNAMQKLASLKRERLELENQILDARQQLTELPMSSENSESAIQINLQKLRQQKAKFSGENSVIIRSPMAAVVSALACHVGQFVSAGQSLASIMPSTRTLQAQVLVPSEAIGYIQPGYSVELHYAAFPYREFGAVTGTVVAVSESALTAGELDTLAGQRGETSMYQVIVSLPHQSVGVEGHNMKLRSGMQLTAVIAINRLRLYQWVFQPLYALRGGANS